MEQTLTQATSTIYYAAHQRPDGSWVRCDGNGERAADYPTRDAAEKDIHFRWSHVYRLGSLGIMRMEGAVLVDSVRPPAHA